MKRNIATTFFVCALAFSPLAACGGNTSSSATSTASTSSATSAANSGDQADRLVPPYGLTGSVTMEQYMRQFVAGYDDFQKGVLDGTRLPDRMHLFVAEDASVYITDAEAMKHAFETLAHVRIDVTNPVEGVGILDGDIDFSFEWDGRVVAFSFETADYASFSDGKMYVCEDPATVSELVDYLKKYAEQPAEPGTELTEVKGAYQWDADGDGQDETLSFDFVDQGDEAPSGFEVSLRGQNVNTGEWLVGAYEITSVVAQEDGQGPYVRVSYFAGDYYQHDYPATCTLRLVDGKLVIEQA